MNKIFISILLLISYGELFARNDIPSRNDTLRVNIEGKLYDRFRLGISGDHSHNAIEGKTDDQLTWLFIYPDSLYERHGSIMFTVPTTEDTLFQCLHIRMDSGNEIFEIGSYNIPRNGEISLKYVKSDFQKKVPFFYYKDLISDTFTLTDRLRSRCTVQLWLPIYI